MKRDRQVLTELTRVLVDSASEPGTLREVVIRLHALLARVAGLDDGAPTAEDSHETILPCGRAISPLDAGRCVLDLARTAKFLRGVRSAIDEAQRRFPNEIIHILYAGCGPFAPLVLPLATFYGPDQVQFTLLDIHHKSIGYVTRVVDALGFSQSVRQFIQADAATYRHPKESPIHVVVIEALQKGLTAEPQVTITLNLAPQLHSKGILVPERITLTACYADLGKEIALLPTGGKRSDLKLASDGRKKRIVLGVPFELTAENALEFAAELSRLGPGGAKHLPCRTLKNKRRSSVAQNLVIFTTVVVFGSIILGDYDSGVTYPVVLPGPPLDTEHENLAFVYQLGQQPGLSYHYA